MNKLIYPPIAQVQNPNSMLHQVDLLPMQSLELRLDINTYLNPKVQVCSDYIELFNIESAANGYHKYYFRQKADLSEWAEYSHCHLGDIWIDTPGTCSKLIVNLVCLNDDKINHVTVVNPDCAEIKLKASNILEVVLYDQFFENFHEWSWDWTPTPGVNLTVEQIDYDILDTLAIANGYYDHPNHFMARLPRMSQKNSIAQTHMWFRFGEDIIQQLGVLPPWKYVGDIRLYGMTENSKPDSFFSTTILEHHIAIHLDSDKSHMNDVVNLLKVPKKEYLAKASFALNNFRRPSLDFLKPRAPTLKNVKIELMNCQIDTGCKTLPALTRQSKFDDLESLEGGCGKESCYDEEQQWKIHSPPFNYGWK